jgi:esterase/lipase
MEDSSFEDWWQRVNNRVDGLVQEGLNSIIILVAWTL